MMERSRGGPEDRERLMFALRMAEGWSLREIGARFGLSSERVRQLIRRYCRAAGVPFPGHSTAARNSRLDDDSSSRAHELANLGRAIREVREERGLNEREVAGAVRGISIAGLRAIEAGSARRSLDYARLLRLAETLGIELTVLMRRVESLRQA